jgi:sorbitol/mannitol transport system substrate-binding protein
MTKLTLAFAIAAILLLVGCKAGPARKLTIATVNNSDMIIMQRLSKQFEEKTGITLEWVVLEENVLRQRVTTDITTGGGQFDVITIGAYETPIWGKQGRLLAVDDLSDGYDYGDILEPVRNGLSYDGRMYAVPFYAESSFTFYRTDLFKKAGLTMPEHPTYEQIKEFAAKLHDPENQNYGIALRGKPGWGENMAFITTMVNTFGGRWFDEGWNPQLTSPAWKEAVSFYTDLQKNYGAPGASSNGHNECRSLFANGNAAMWVDATSAAGYIFDKSQSKVYDKVGFTSAPTAKVPNGAGWAWSWGLAIPTSSKRADAAREFLKWATSKEYVRLVGETEGWTVIPPGTRKSTYQISEYRNAAPFADFVLKAILAADPSHPTAEPVPYTGVQFVAIPEFQGIGTQVGQSIAAALSGQMPVDQALETAQRATERTMKQAGYIKQ